MFFGLIDPAAGSLGYSNAGHNPPLLIRESGELEGLEAMGTVLGIVPEIGYEERSRAFHPGDMLVIYSDGVTEAESPGGEEFGEQRLADLLVAHREEPAAEIVELVIQAVAEWIAGAPPADDVTLLVARRIG